MTNGSGGGAEGAGGAWTAQPTSVVPSGACSHTALQPSALRVQCHRSTLHTERWTRPWLDVAAVALEETPNPVSESL